MSFELFAGAFGGGAAFTVALWVVFGQRFFVRYLEKKAENLATREDIGQLTNQVEIVKAQYSELLELQKARHQLRAAAIEKRLEAHQKAYSNWRRLIGSVHGENIADIVMDCQSWWDGNCLYLDAKSREAFRESYQAAFHHKELLAAKEDLELAKENWSKIMAAGPIIVEGAELPSLGELETTTLGEIGDSDS